MFTDYTHFSWGQGGSEIGKECRGGFREKFHSDKKDNKIFLIYKKIQKGAVAKSYMTNGLLIYD